MMKSVVMITGASSGIGKVAAELFASKGFTVYATARKPEMLSELAKLGCRTLQLDVTNEESMLAAVQKIETEAGGVDILVNNAGYGQNGVIEELSLEAIRKQFETNVFGLVRMCQLVLPLMRQKGSGRIINIGSVGGDFTAPGASAYHASKYALEAFSDGLRMEVKPFGVTVSLIKPGGVRTNFIGETNRNFPPEMPNSPYRKFRENFARVSNKIFESDSSYGILTPEQVAQAILRAATDRRPKTRYRVGILAKMMPLFRKITPDKIFDALMAKQFSAK